jgi:hypothetical protein
MSAPASSPIRSPKFGPTGTPVVRSKSRDCVTFDCFSRTKSDPTPITVLEMEVAPPRYSKLFIDVDAAPRPMIRDTGVSRFFTATLCSNIPKAESPVEIRPQPPLPREHSYAKSLPMQSHKRTSILRRSPSFNPEGNSVIPRLTRSSISMIPDDRIPIPPVTNPFNLPELPARDYILNKIKADENRTKIQLLDKLENEVTNVFYSKANQSFTPQQIYSELFYGIMAVFADSYEQVKRPEGQPE